MAALDSGPFERERFDGFWSVILYPHLEEHSKILDTIFDDYNCIGIFHDRDLRKDGILYCPHWHIVIYSEDPYVRPNVMYNFSQFSHYPLRNMRKSIDYLVNSTSHYSVNDFVGAVNTYFFSKYLKKYKKQNRAVKENEI